MHKDFAEWYRQAGIDPESEVLIKRWTAIDNYNPNHDDIVSLAQLFYCLGKPSDMFVSGFVKIFQDTDPIFKARDNQHELSVLAGATLIDVIESAENKRADMAALSLASAAAQNLRPSPCVSEIPEIAIRYLGKRSVNREEVEKEETEADTSHKLHELGSRLSIVSEECNMLWWLFSEYSRDEEKPWKTFSLPAVAIMAGKELADLTLKIPGPNAVLAFLDKVIRCVKSEPPESVPIKDAVNQLSVEWRERYAESHCTSKLQDLLPISEGIKLSMLSKKKQAWEPLFAQKVAIKAAAKIAPRKLAYQVFVENLLRRSYQEFE